MRSRTALSLAVLAVLVALGATSFYLNVLRSPAPRAEAGGAATATAPPQTAADVLPVTVAGLPLTARTQGAEAVSEVEELHGKTLGRGLDGAWIGVYGADAEGRPEATIWVSRSVRVEDAEDLLVRMRDRIGQGRSPFTDRGTVQVGGVVAYDLDGMGQKHYYFRVDKDVYWLAIDAERAGQALEGLVSGARAAAAKG